MCREILPHERYDLHFHVGSNNQIVLKNQNYEDFALEYSMQLR